MSASDAVNQARLLMSTGQYVKASQMMIRHLQRNGSDIPALECASDIFKAQGDYAKAVFYREKALSLRPTDGRLVVLLAGVYQAQNDLDKTHEVLIKAHERLPKSLEIITSLTMFYGQVDQPDRALEICEQGLAIDPSYPQLRMAYADLLQRQGHSAQASEIMEQTLAQHDFGATSRIAHAVVSHYNPKATPGEVFEIHKRVGRAIAQSSEFEPLSHARGTDPEKRLRVGILSPDLRRHSVMFFAESIIDHLDRDRFEIVAISNSGVEDDASDRVKTKVAQWQVVTGLSAAYKAKKILDLKIDVLIDLGGLTKGHAAASLHLRPAPVIVSYIGYPDTLGIANVGHRIVDSWTDPTGTPYRADDFAVEKLTRLDPCFLCYRPEPEFLALDPAPAEPSRDGITFGSFNHAQKINDELMRTWAKLLHETPASRLMVKATRTENPLARGALQQRMVEAGISADRLTVVERTADQIEHLKLYRQIDLAIDTFPYHGTTTTCEALLMGVPVVTRAGMTHASRVGVSLLNNAGLGELVAKDEADYIQIASRLASDRSRLAALRGPALRKRLLESPICDGPAYGKRLGQALRSMWRAHCAGV